ncbi:MAG TPA: TfoX/Sxy family protein, partial [Anaeromyxobacter sp.]
MANSPDFVAHAVELLSGVGPVEARAMFGGHGMYARGVMFGLLDGDELFLKTDGASRPRFVEAGCRQWVYVSRTRRMENTSWFRPPDDAHEDSEAMAVWAALGLESALRARAARGARGKRG